VQWSRRPSDAELAQLVAVEQARRDLALAGADPSRPRPEFGPLPSAGDTTIAVFACADHTVDLEHAARVHAADCQAPHPDHLPSCDCEPEPHPEPTPLGGPKVQLPTGWVVAVPPTN
jgi:hypothetical protein